MTVGAPWPVDALPAPTLLHKLEIRSVFLASAVLVAFLVLAYLTNPGESSFRAYLTEQSFRQHLSRLDEADGEAEPARFDPDAALRRDLLRARARPPVHFASRAAVSLRTPRHVLHSCGVLTLGAVLPEDETRRTPDPAHQDLLLDGPPGVGDAWYVGAFGRWWRGGVLDAWWLDAISTASTQKVDETAGVLRMSTLDKPEGLPFSVPSFASNLRAPTRLAQDSSHVPNTTQSARDSTPPPLPKSASLPLHTKPEQRTPVKPSPSLGCSTPGKGKGPTRLEVTRPPPSRSPSNTNISALSSSLDASPSPAIAELARQLAVSEAATVDLRSQLAEADTCAVEAREALETELADHRARKRAEDSARTEMRVKTKTLEDQKRGAEAGKKEAERKLRNAKAQRDQARDRRERLLREIKQSERKGVDDRTVAKEAEKEADELEEEGGHEAERKRKEIKVAEDVVAALNVRAKELEELLEKERVRLADAKEQAELQRQDLFFSMQAAADDRSADFDVIHPDGGLWEADAFNPEPLPHAQVHVYTPHRRGSTDPQTPPHSRPRRLSLTGISNFDPSAPVDVLLPVTINASTLAPIPASSGVPRFSPFSADDDATFLGVQVPQGSAELSISPGGVQNLLSTSLVRSLALDTPTTALETSSVSLPGTGNGTVSTRPSSAGLGGMLFARSDDDPILTKPKRSSLGATKPLAIADWISESPSAYIEPEEDVFRVRAPPEMLRPGPDRMDSQRAVLSRTRSDPLKALAAVGITLPEVPDRMSTSRRWFSVSTKADKDKDKDKDHKEKKDDDRSAKKRGLNPDAKAFTLPTSFSASTGRHSLGASAAGAASRAPLDLNTFISVPHLAGGGFGFGSKDDPFVALVGGGQPFGSTYDMLNPSAVSLGGSTLSSVPSTTAPASGWAGWGGLLTPSSFSMRAFAPSKAERAALGHALGASHSGSLERLPSLSAVGSMPSSPERAGVALAGPDPIPGKKWFQSLPKLAMNMGRKPKFSPFDDDEAAEKE